MTGANKGEWSELYVLFKLLGEKKVHAGDGDLNKLEVYYPILRILRNELERSLEYAVGDKDMVVITEDGVKVTEISVGEFLHNSVILFKEIKDGSRGNGSFEIPSLAGFLKKIHCEKIKANSSDKADIHIVLHDYHTGMEPNLGFSIKSDVGSPPTLLNSSDATIFVYEVAGDGATDETMERVNTVEGKAKVQKRVNAIYDSGARLVFKKINNDVFCGNLRMIDGNLPEMLAWMMADSYLQRDMDIRKATERIKEANPMKFDLSLGHDYYGYKLKAMMTAVALGMLPAKVWNGKYEATGGYLVVKDDGEVLCFHIYDRNTLEEYILKNTRFETPSTKRYGFGEIYKKEDDCKYYFKLALQIRFK